ncbi:MAG TPA: hypothetical protein VJ623_10105 [Holophagaceae bacterium]|nr:hypothetical protein [Holophagaceae bacterium]
MSKRELVHTDATFSNVSGFSLGPAGRQMAAWVNGAGQTVTLESSDATGWDASTSLVGSAPGAMLGLAYDAQGNAFAAFAKAWTAVTYSVAVKAPGMPWGAPVDLGTVPDVANPVRLLVAPTGYAALVWQQTYTGSEGLWARVYTPGSGWGAAQLLTASGTLSAVELRGCVGTDGSIYAGVVYADYTTYTNELRVVRYQPATGWTSPTAPAATGTSFSDLLMVGLPGGKLLTLWASPQPGLTGAELSGGAWTTPSSYLSVRTLVCNDPHVAVSSNGTLLFAWRSSISGTSEENVYAALREGGVTSNEVPLGPAHQRDALITGLGFDADGLATVVGFSDHWDNGALVGHPWISNYH